MDLESHFEEFRDALLSAFRLEGELEQFAKLRIKLELDDHIARGPKAMRVFDLIKWADSRDLTDFLFAEALRANPRNRELRRLADKLKLELDQTYDRQAQALVQLKSADYENPHAAEIEQICKQTQPDSVVSLGRTTGHLQAMVVSAEHLQNGASISNWISDFEQRLHATCSIGAGGKHKGTGFLIGPDLIMTNCHVVDVVAISEMTVVFDYSDDADRGKLPAYGVAAELARSSPRELDFAILKLKQVPAGNRGYLKATSRLLVFREPIHVIGHPNGNSLQRSSGVIFDENSYQGRVAYSANTDPGSSGSPVFDDNWRLVAMHHHGESGMNNHGIPMSQIRSHLDEHGAKGLLEMTP